MTIVTIRVKYQYNHLIYGDIYDCWTEGGRHETRYCAIRDQALAFVRETAGGYEQARWVNRDGSPAPAPQVDVIWEGPNPDDENYAQIQRAAEDLRYLICASGGMATKSRVEDYLIRQFGISRYLAHNVMNDQEARNVLPVVFSDGKAYWNQAQMSRPAPEPAQYPHLCKDDAW